MSTSFNPYQAPQPDPSPQVQGVRSGALEDLVAVAKYQRGIMVCILIYIMLFVLNFCVPEEFRLIPAGLILLNGLVGMVFVVLLAMRVYHPVLGLLFGLLTVVPCLGLIVLLLVNGRATSTLTRNGVKVGLLGCNPDLVPQAVAQHQQAGASPFR